MFLLTFNLMSLWLFVTESLGAAIPSQGGRNPLRQVKDREENKNQVFSTHF